jgi:hypothetical protein
MLLIETGSAKRIDPQRIGTELPGDGGCRYLRSSRHDRPVFQAFSEGFERLFREANDGPCTTSKHAHFLFFIVVVEIYQHLRLAARGNWSAGKFERSFPETSGPCDPTAWRLAPDLSTFLPQGGFQWVCFYITCHAPVDSRKRQVELSAEFYFATRRFVRVRLRIHASICGAQPAPSQLL